MNAARAVVTGVGAVCAAGHCTREIMQNLYAGKRNPAPPRRLRVELPRGYPVFEVGDNLPDVSGFFDFGRLERFRLSGSGLTEAGKVLDSENPRGLKPAARRAEGESAPGAGISRTNHLALIALAEALRQARLDIKELKTRRVGVCLGTTVGCTLNDEPFYRSFRNGARPEITPVRRYLEGNPARLVSRALGLQGPVATIANACSSGTDAVGLAKAWVERDLCDVVIAGGCDELSRIPYLGFIRLLISAPEPCLPFDRHRQGLNLGEGAGILIVERAESAAARGVTALARIMGYASCADAHHPTAPHPQGRGFRRAIHLAIQQAGLEPAQIGFVNAHGTATLDNDRVEGRVLKELLGPGAPVVATKYYTGHTLGAAGGLEAVFTVQALIDQQVPPAAGFEEIDPEIGIELRRETSAVDARFALSNSLAFGGNNSVLLLERGVDA